MNFNELLPLTNADDIRRLDRLSCERQGINALQLMERAALHRQTAGTLPG